MSGKRVKPENIYLFEEKSKLFEFNICAQQISLLIVLEKKKIVTWEVDLTFLYILNAEHR